MTFVVYHKDTTRYMRNHPEVVTDKTSFASEGAAKAAVTREAKRGTIKAEDFLIAEKGLFHDTIEKTVTKKNSQTGKEFSQPINTPWCCDPSSETFFAI